MNYLSEAYSNPWINTAIGFTPVLGDIQSGYETIKSAREGKYTEAALNALGLLPYVPSLGKLSAVGGMAGMIKASHGTPHEFDKFKLSKINSGEGAQVYGHGLYFAENHNSPVAEFYAEKLAKPEVLFGGKRLSEIDNVSDEAKQFAHAVQSQIGATSFNNRSNFLHEKSSHFLNRPLIEELGPLDYHLPNFNLYNIDLKWPNKIKEKSTPLEKNDLLDWDNPIASQSKIKNVLDQSNLYFHDNMTGEDLYNQLLEELTPKQASKFLNNLGIPGIRYLDQDSRHSYNGTSNFVIFDDKIPKISEHKKLYSNF